MKNEEILKIIGDKLIKREYKSFEEKHLDTINLARKSERDEIKKKIEKKINIIATHKEELSLAGNKRACCIMTLEEFLKEIDE